MVRARALLSRLDMRSTIENEIGRRLATAMVIGALVLALPALGSAKGNGGGSRGRDVETRIAALHKELRITPEQESAWNDVAQAMRENARRMADVRRQQDEGATTANAPQMIDAYGKTMDAHAESIRKFAGVFQSLYDSMSDAQQKTADEVFRRRVQEAATKKRKAS